MNAIAKPGSSTDQLGLDLVARAETLYDQRRRRNHVFGTDNLFQEPVWDLLLYLFIAGERSRGVSVVEACHSSGVPETTALRWLQMLRRDEWVRSLPHPADRRIKLVELTPAIKEKMRTYLSTIQEQPSRGDPVDTVSPECRPY